MNQSRAIQGLRSQLQSAQMHAARAQMNELHRNLIDARDRAQGALDMSASPISLSGEFMINGAGEALIEDINFSCTFLDKPLVSFGFEMKDGEVYIPGFMATAEGKVLRWKTEERPPTTRYYTGFTIGAVTTGPTHQKMIGVWTVTGFALTGPSGAYYG